VRALSSRDSRPPHETGESARRASEQCALERDDPILEHLDPLNDRLEVDLSYSDALGSVRGILYNRRHAQTQGPLSRWEAEGRTVTREVLDPHQRVVQAPVQDVHAVPETAHHELLADDDLVPAHTQSVETMRVEHTLLDDRAGQD
jgi:hypothetical protein